MPHLAILSQKQVKPGEQAFLYNIESVKNNKTPQVVATAARIYDERASGNVYSFVAKSPLNTTNVMRILLPKKPREVRVTDASNNKILSDTSWDEASKTCFLTFENHPEGVHVNLSW